MFMPTNPPLTFFKYHVSGMILIVSSSLSQANRRPNAIIIAKDLI